MIFTSDCLIGPRPSRWIGLLGLLFVIQQGAAPAFAHEHLEKGKEQESEGPALTERPGGLIPLEAAFLNEDGKPVALKGIVDRPTILTLVYYRCAGICSSLLHEVADTIDRLPDLRAGTDYRLVTLSFDAREGPDLAKRAHKDVVTGMKSPIPAAAWTFLTGDPTNIEKVTDAAGFQFSFVPATGEFVHPTTVIFLTREGRISRYLDGLTILPADLKMAVMDASEGRVGNFMAKLQRLCYGYDAKGGKYLIQIDRIILFATISIVALFGLFLAFLGKGKRKTVGQTQ